MNPPPSKLLGKLDGFWFETAPAERPAILRILVGVWTLHYLVRRYRMLMKVAASDPALFEPVGVAKGLERPLPTSVFRLLLIATFIANIFFILGFWHRVTGPLFSGLLLWVLCYRNSWSMIYHNDNALALHALVLGMARSADALSLDSLLDASESPEPHWKYGWPVKLMSAITTLTYFLAGVAKVKGPLGWSWAGGEALRSQVAVDGLRKELLGDGAPRLAYALYSRKSLFGVMGLGSLVLELAAPLFLANKKLSKLWAAGAFQMHWGIYFIMDIKFRYQLTGLVFASFLDLDRILSFLRKISKG